MSLVLFPGFLEEEPTPGTHPTLLLTKNNKKQAIRAVSRQTIVPNIRRDTMSSWPLLLQCRTAGTLQLALYFTIMAPAE
jgi:hypothetical protein